MCAGRVEGFFELQGVNSELLATAGDFPPRASASPPRPGPLKEPNSSRLGPERERSPICAMAVPVMAPLGWRLMSATADRTRAHPPRAWA